METVKTAAYISLEEESDAWILDWAQGSGLDNRTTSRLPGS